MTDPGHLLVIGAGANQVGTIERARRRGLRVTATDRDPEAIGFRMADHGLLASTRDADETLAAVAAVHELHPIDGVMTIASESAITVASVARELGLPGTDVDAARRATDKLARLESFSGAGVPCARWTAALSADEVVAAAGHIGWPVVVKPIDGAGSRGVRRLDGPHQVESAVAEIASVSRDVRVVVEEFLAGTEHSIEGIVVEGVTHWTAFSDRNYADKERFAPHFFEDGDTFPTRLSGSDVARLTTAADAAVTALGIRHGPVKGDLLLGHDGPLVIEMAARLSGDRFCEHTAPLHHGIELVEVVMDQALGLAVDTALLRPIGNRPIAYRGVWVDIDADVRPDLDAIAVLEGVLRVDRDDTLASGGAMRRIATVHATGNRREDAVANAVRAVTAARGVRDRPAAA